MCCNTISEQVYKLCCDGIAVAGSTHIGLSCSSKVIDMIENLVQDTLEWWY